jgi:heavy metal translocating P-type ATPase
MKKIKAFLENDSLRITWSLALSLPALVLSYIGWPGLPFDAAWVAIILCGVPIVAEAIEGLVTSFDITADLLVAMAIVASVVINEVFAAGEVAVIMQLGELLEELTVRRARSGIEKLIKLKPRTARLLRGGKEEVIPAEGVKTGDILRVNPGETIAADGILVSGETSVDESVMTGESIPVDKLSGDEVKSGTVNQLGAFDMRVTRDGADSSLQRMIRLVESADASKAKVVGIADRWATWIVLAALTAAIATWIITGIFLRAVTILVVFCPCALVLATPTAVMAAIGNVTKYGVLVKEGDALERLSSATDVAFDKTGTLTLGKPEVTAVNAYISGLTEDDVLRCAAAAEKRSEHPLGKAIVRAFQKRFGTEPDESDDFHMTVGRGVFAETHGHKIIAGNAALLADEGLTPPEKENGDGTAIYIVMDGRLIGSVFLADRLRGTAQDTVTAIKDMGLRPILLTGDRESIAKSAAASAGIQDYRASCLPEDKLSEIRRLQHDGRKVCMIGDGVNDAPALAEAWTGIAMGGVGSDIAVEAADIAFVKDDIQSFPHLLAVSRRMMSVIRVNLVFSMTLNIVAVILAAAGSIDPVIGALVHNAGSVLVVSNSAFLLRWKKKIKR